MEVRLVVGELKPLECDFVRGFWLFELRLERFGGE